MTDRAVVVGSNRGPVAFEPGPDGPRARRGSGGLVTALTGALQDGGGTWVAAAMTATDRAVAGGAGDRAIDLGSHGFPFGLRMLEIAQDDYDGYYAGVSNGLLWFAHHHLWDTVRSPLFGEDVPRVFEAYERVNRTFAVAMAEEAGRLPGRPTFLVQDYHLALVPAMLRELLPDAAIAHFSHTSIAGPTYFRILPERIADRILYGMLGADVLGFHARGWAENFLMTARGLPGVHADLGRSRLLVDGREVRTRVHPISVDAGAIRAETDGDRVRRRRREFQTWRGTGAMILRVDRLELSKNIVRGFLAYELFLRRNPGWRGRVQFLAMLSPSRLDIPEYRTYADECLAEADRVNRQFGTASWTPVTVRLQEDYEGALAAYAFYDVLLVNPVIDGMNLVAMEGPLVNRRSGTLVLSRNAGAYGRLARHAIGVNPYDLDETASAIERGLAMGVDERRRRARGLARLVLANPPERWIRGQLDDLEDAARRRTRLLRQAS
ncbi:MAG: trehalose-6-phosphate synthase [Actinomycetota bacterium]